MRALLLSNRDKPVFVDDDVYEQIKHYAWYDNGHGYAYRSIRIKDKVQKIALHHTVVGKPPKAMDADHINGDTLDNRRENLRFVNRRVNALNSKRTTIQQYGNTWRLRYCIDGGLRVRVSGFKTREEAESVAALLKGALIYHELTKGAHHG